MSAADYRSLLEHSHDARGVVHLSGVNNEVSFESGRRQAPKAELYFTAGPRQATQGLFGYLIPVDAELVEGNDQ